MKSLSIIWFNVWPVECLVHVGSCTSHFFTIIIKQQTPGLIVGFLRIYVLATSYQISGFISNKLFKVMQTVTVLDTLTWLPEDRSH